MPLTSFPPVVASPSVVAGYLDNNPLGQFASCTSQFGSPAISTVTPAEDVVFATVTSTASYTDIIVSLETTSLTVDQTSTSYATVTDVETAYTTTLTSTITDTVAAPTVSLNKKAVRNKKKRGCGRGSSTASTTPTTSSTAAPGCTDGAAYMSACACIYAIDSTNTVTASPTTTTETVYETVSTTLFETSSSMVTVVMTIVVLEPAPITLTSTTTVGEIATATFTTTTTPVAETQTSYIVVSGGNFDGDALLNEGIFITPDVGGLGTKFVVSPAGGDIWPAGSPDTPLRLEIDSSGDYGFVVPEAITTSADPTLSCSVDLGSGALACSATGGFSELYLCNALLSLAKPGFDSFTAGCEVVDLKLSS